MQTEKPEPKVRTPSDLSKSIEDIVWMKDVSYIDATIIYCNENNLEFETVASAIRMNSNLKGKLQIEAESLNFIKKTSRLPVL